MALADILAHTATPLREIQQQWVEGERVLAQVREEPFPCVLFLPTAGVDNRGGRVVIKPQVMYLTHYPPAPAGSGAPVALRAGDKLAIVAPEQNEAEGRAPGTEITWLVEARPQPLGKPGEEPVGVFVTVRLVEE